MEEISSSAGETFGSLRDGEAEAQDR